MKILYLGRVSGTCLDRADALRRLGHELLHIDVRKLMPRTVWVDRITWRLGGNWFSPWVNRGLRARVGSQTFDLCYVDGGEWMTGSTLQLLHEHAPLVVNYNIDDPFGPRDGARLNAYRHNAWRYDVCVVMREENIEEARAHGVRNVLRVYRSADEVAHAPRPLSAEDRERWKADVLFLGTWFPERGPFLLELVERGVPLTIRGHKWTKAPEWERLKPYWKGGSLFGDDYARAIQCAKVNLGLLSKDNRDLHTTRSLEVPALGGLLCAQRTSEHVSMYKEGQEALFWDDADECARMCHEVLADEELRSRIAAAGHARIRQNGHYNENVLREILDFAAALEVHGAGEPA
jgi:spore maturation protein CgeB